MNTHLIASLYYTVVIVHCRPPHPFLLEHSSTTCTFIALLLYPRDVLPTDCVPRLHILLHALSKTGRLAAR